MKTVYKLTDINMQTYEGFQWELNKWVKTSGAGELCSKGWLHAYTHPLLAVLLNPIHGNYYGGVTKDSITTGIRLFEAEARGECKEDSGLKIGYTEMRLVKEIKVPEINLIQKVAFGILASLKVENSADYIRWANKWLSGEDRSAEAARAARAAARAAWAAEAAGWAAWAAGWAAEAAARAASSTVRAEIKVDLVAIAKEAMEVK